MPEAKKEPEALPESDNRFRYDEEKKIELDLGRKEVDPAAPRKKPKRLVRKSRSSCSIRFLRSLVNKRRPLFSLIALTVVNIYIRMWIKRPGSCPSDILRSLRCEYANGKRYSLGDSGLK